MGHTEGKLEVGTTYLTHNARSWETYVVIVGIGMVATAHGETEDEAQANAARLKMCWNCHDDLIAALDNCTALIEALGETVLKDRWPSGSNTAKTARALLSRISQPPKGQE